MPLVLLIICSLILSACSQPGQIAQSGQIEVIPAPGSTDTSYDNSDDGWSSPPGSKSNSAPEVPIGQGAANDTAQNLLDPSSQDLHGLGSLYFGMSPDQAVSLNHDLEWSSDNESAFLSAIVIVDGLECLEDLRFAGTPQRLASITLKPTSFSDQTSRVVAGLATKYGVDVYSPAPSSLQSALYTWTFRNQAQIQVNTDLGMTSIVYSAPPEAIVNQGF